MQKAVFVKEVGKPVELGTRTIPSPKADEILIKIAATMLLPHDTYGRDWGLFIGEKLPYVLGTNIAGTVEKVGEDVTPFATGDSGFGLSSFTAPTPDQAGLQEYAILNANAAAKSPPGFTHDQVATLPVNLATSFLALKLLGFPPPFSNEAATFDYAAQTLLVLGAGASVGKFAIQLAALSGVGKIIAVAGPGSADELRVMGATHFFDRHLSREELATQVHALTGEEGVTHIYHCHGFDYDLDAALLAKDKKTFLQSVHPVDEEVGQKLRAERPMCEVAMVEGSNEGLAPHTEAFWRHVPQWLDERKVLPGKFRVIEGLEKVDEINDALDGYREGGGVQVIVHP